MLEFLRRTATALSWKRKCCHSVDGVSFVLRRLQYKSPVLAVIRTPRCRKGCSCEFYSTFPELQLIFSPDLLTTHSVGVAPAGEDAEGSDRAERGRVYGRHKDLLRGRSAEKGDLPSLFFVESLDTDFLHGSSRRSILVTGVRHFHYQGENTYRSAYNSSIGQQERFGVWTSLSRTLRHDAGISVPNEERGLSFQNDLGLCEDLFAEHVPNSMRNW